MARSNFPREDDESKFKRGQTRVVNQMARKAQTPSEETLLRELAATAYLEGWKAAMRLVLRLNKK